jgi:tetratricopeptide (TPR) repeat protein
MNRHSRRIVILLVLILLAALALRLWLWSRPAHPLANDETEYFTVGMDLAHGRGFVFYDTYRWLRAPLYPLFLALFFWVGGDHARVATLAQVLLSTATVYGFYLLARRLFRGEWSERAGLASALLAALLLPFATFPALFMAETLFTFLLVAFLLAILQVPEAPPARRWRWAAAAGLLLGLCALTRAVALVFMPLAAAWLYFCLWPKGRAGPPDTGGHQAGPYVRMLGLPALLILAGLATIAPWTIRNAIAYQRFIPLDTGAAYSLWAFYEPHEEQEEINRQMEAIPNPADRQAYAVHKWLQRLGEDPAIVLRKLPKTFPYLLRIKPIEDRFLKLPYHEPSLPYFLLALLADDGLYVLITLGALVAFLFLPADRGKTLALLWLLYNVAVMMVLHAEARYRQLLFPAMIPYAGLVLAQGRHLFSSVKKGRVWRTAALALLLAGWGYCFGAYSPWDWVALNVHRGFYQTLGQVDWTLGRPEAALQAYTRAMEVDGRNPEPYYDLAWAYEHLGRLDEAAKAYRWCWGTRANYLPCSTALGNILRQQGRLDEAREAFLGRYVAEEDVVAWAWDNLAVPPAERVDVGDGLDYGYVSGVHAPERAGAVLYRWTTGRALFRLLPEHSGQVRLHLRLAAPRLGQSAPAAVDISVNGSQVAHWEVPPPWGTYETPPFPVQEGQRLEIVLQSATFVPQQADPRSPDTRALGVQVDWAEVVAEK